MNAKYPKFQDFIIVPWNLGEKKKAKFHIYNKKRRFICIKANYLGYVIMYSQYLLMKILLQNMKLWLWFVQCLLPKLKSNWSPQGYDYIWFIERLLSKLTKYWRPWRHDYIWFVESILPKLKKDWRSWGYDYIWLIESSWLRLKKDWRQWGCDYI